MISDKNVPIHPVSLKEREINLYKRQPTFKIGRPYDI